MFCDKVDKNFVSHEEIDMITVSFTYNFVALSTVFKFMKTQKYQVFNYINIIANFFVDIISSGFKESKGKKISLRYTTRLTIFKLFIRRLIFYEKYCNYLILIHFIFRISLPLFNS